MRVTKLLRQLVGLCSSMVIEGWELRHQADGGRPCLVLKVRQRTQMKGRCGVCAEPSPWFDRGGRERSWRHLDIGFATCEIVCQARRVSCHAHGPTVAAVAFARHDSAFTRDFEDLVVYDAVTSNKLAAARRHGVTASAGEQSTACALRVATEALGRVDLLSGLVAISIDEVKYNYVGDLVKGDSISFL
ncbi:MAG: transposase family protein [Acidimicrobiales bacterium]